MMSPEELEDLLDKAEGIIEGGNAPDSFEELYDDILEIQDDMEENPNDEELQEELDEMIEELTDLISPVEKTTNTSPVKSAISFIAETFY